MPGFLFEANQKIRQQAGIDVVRRLKAVSRVIFVSANDRYWPMTVLHQALIKKFANWLESTQTGSTEFLSKGQELKADIEIQTEIDLSSPSFFL